MNYIEEHVVQNLQRKMKNAHRGMSLFSKRVGFKTQKPSISHFRPLCSHFHIFPENPLTETFLQTRVPPILTFISRYFRKPDANLSEPQS